jgi:hypothetical protein
MLLIIIGIVAWPILAHAARLSVAAIAISYGVVLAVKIRSTERVILAFAPAGDRTLADFDRKPTRHQRRAMRANLKLALRQTEFRSLFPNIAQRTQQFVRAETR